MATKKSHVRSGAELGTFAGVFTPSILTILGLILFRRLGFVVGGVGILQAIGIVMLAQSIAVLTSVSLSAIATNIRVKGGGDYYLISRSLGVEFGGAIGMVLYFAQSISVAFYCVGLGEAVAELGAGSVLSEPRVVATAAALLLFGFAYAGADVATKLQFAILTLLAAAIASFFVGGLAAASLETLASNWKGRSATGPDFWILFGIYFPAVTGFTQGVSMSGDLREPGESLPRGTFLAVGVSFLIYLSAVLVFGASLPAHELAADYDAMGRVALFPPLIVAGLLAATLSSALTSLLGAPRILQSLSADGVFPLLAPFSKGHGPANNPRRGVVLSFGIALAFIAVSNINVIAPVVSMFFLISYGLLNYATAFEARAESPSFRPRFRFFHYRTSLLGAFGCLAVMLMISPIATAVALSILFAVHHYIDRMARPEHWADSKRDHYFQSLRRNLLAMSKEMEHPRNWRPRILVFSDHAKRRKLLLRFASWIEGHAGLTTVVRMIEGRRDRVLESCARAEQSLQAAIEELGIDAFAVVVAMPDLEIGAETLLQATGTGPLQANIALLNWLGQPFDTAREENEHTRAYARQIRAIARIGVNVVVLDASDAEWNAVSRKPTRERRIDVWWENDPTSRLMLLLAYMMTRTDAWHDAQIRVLSPAQPRSARRIEVKLEEMLESVRIRAEAEVLDTWTAEALIEKSRDADLVFLPLRVRRLSFRDPFGRPADDMLQELGMVAMALAGEDIDLDPDPEEKVGAA